MEMKPFLQQVAEILVEQKGKQLSGCAIVFNNKRPANYLQKYMADLIAKPFFSPSFYTIQEFFAETTNFKIADFYQQFFTLHHTYNQLLAEEKLDPVSSHKFFPLAKIILADFVQMDADLVDAEKLYRNLEDIALISKDFDYLSPEQYQFLSQFWTSYSEGKHKKQQELFIQMWRRMPKLYHQFHAALKAKNCLTIGSVYRQLADDLNLDHPFLKGFDQENIIFVGFNALSKAEAKIFTQLQNNAKALFFFDTDSYYIDDPLQEAGLFLRKNLFKLGLKNSFGQQPSMLKAVKHDINVFKVQGQAAQAKILTQILNFNPSSQNGVGKSVVVLADESLLIPTLQTIPSHHHGEEVKLNVTMGFALSSSSMYGLIDLWANCQLALMHHDKLNFKWVEAFITHPLCGLSQKMRDKILSALLQENQLEVELPRLQRQGGLFTLFFKPITTPKQTVSYLLAVLDLIMLRQNEAQTLKQIDAELFVKTRQTLNRLHDMLDEHLGEQEDKAFAIYLVQKSMQAVSVPLAGDPLEGIQVMGLLETRNLNFDQVTILGFNEGIIPKSSIGSSFIPDSLRRVYDLPVLENLDAISAYMVYRLIQRAKNINLVYNSLTDESNSGEPSRILKQLAYESNFNFKYFELKTEIKTEAWVNVQIEKTANPLIQQKLNLYLNKQKTLSPSAITQYIANPIDFFFNYIAEIKKPEAVSEVVEANEVGSILHKAMEYFYQDLKHEEISKERILARRQHLPQIIERAFNQVMFNNSEGVFEYKGMQKVILAIVAAYIDVILDADMAKSPFRILSLEQKISAEISFPLGDKEGSVKIYGLIDRVDEHEGVVKIIDYKTGSDKLDYRTIEGLFNTNGKEINKAMIQTLIYTYLYEQVSGKSGVEPNLYIVKSMSDGKIHFQSKSIKLYGAVLEDAKITFLNELKSKLTELFEAPYFVVSEVPSNYQYSIYKTLFGR